MPPATDERFLKQQQQMSKYNYGDYGGLYCPGGADPTPSHDGYWSNDPEEDMSTGQGKYRKKRRSSSKAARSSSKKRSQSAVRFSRQTSRKSATRRTAIKKRGKKPAALKKSLTYPQVLGPKYPYAQRYGQGCKKRGACYE